MGVTFIYHVEGVFRIYYILCIHNVLVMEVCRFRTQTSCDVLAQGEVLLSVSASLETETSIHKHTQHSPAREYVPTQLHVLNIRTGLIAFYSHIYTSILCLQDR